MIISLPWPDKKLSPNARIHWAQKARAKHAAKEAAYFIAWSHIIESPFDRSKQYRMILTFCPPDKRRRDLDNIEASCKAAFDGMCEGLQIDDSQIIETRKRWGEVVKCGDVIVELEAV